MSHDCEYKWALGVVLGTYPTTDRKWAETMLYVHEQLPGFYGDHGNYWEEVRAVRDGLMKYEDFFKQYREYRP